MCGGVPGKCIGVWPGECVESPVKKFNVCLLLGWGSCNSRYIDAQNTNAFTQCVLAPPFAEV